MNLLTQKKIINAIYFSNLLSSPNKKGFKFEESGMFDNVTITAQSVNFTHNSYGAVTKGNVVKQVNAGNVAFFGPFKQKAFNDTNEYVQLTYLTTGGAALSTVSSGTHALKIEVLYLDQN